MDIYTLDNSYARQEIIDAYESAIWTERYKGDGDFELNIPVDSSVLDILPTGTLLECEGSEQPMIIEEIDTEGGNSKMTGITITEWMNNRFLRSSPDWTEKTWTVTDVPMSQLITNIVQNWCIDSTYLTDHPAGPPFPADSMGFRYSAYLKIPGLFIASWTPTQVNGVPVPHFTGDIDFGPVYDTIRQLADQAQVGMKTYLHDLGAGKRNIGFMVYVGKVLASVNTNGKTIVFSPRAESLQNIKELQSEKDHWNEVYMFLQNVADLTNPVGNQENGVMQADYTDVYQNGQSRPIKTTWDRRVQMIFSDVSQDDYDAIVPWDHITPPFRPDTPMDIELKQALIDHKFVHLLDGEITPSADLTYGKDYHLGDVVAMQGYGGSMISGQVTEFIRSKDREGEKAFPTVETFPGSSIFWRSEFP